MYMKQNHIIGILCYFLLTLKFRSCISLTALSICSLCRSIPAICSAFLCCIIYRENVVKKACEALIFWPPFLGVLGRGQICWIQGET